MTAHPLGDHRHARAPRFKTPPTTSTPPPPAAAPQPVEVLSLDQLVERLPRFLEAPPR